MLTSLAESNPQPDLTATKTNDDQKRAIVMAHVHLPKMDECGFIDWDREERTVTKGPRFDEIKPLLTMLIDTQHELSGNVLVN